MISDKAGNTVILAGNNLQKTSYILQSLQAGFHVLGDKPMVIDDHAFTSLLQAFDTAAAHRTILYDIMTERYEITSILQRELAMDQAYLRHSGERQSVQSRRRQREHPSLVQICFR